MANEEFSPAPSRINAPGGFVKVGGRLLMPHLRWELEQVMSRVQPEDLSAVETAALLSILMPADSRVVGGPDRRTRELQDKTRDLSWPRKGEPNG